jgi:hypothetical protein
LKRRSKTTDVVHAGFRYERRGGDAAEIADVIARRLENDDGELSRELRATTYHIVFVARVCVHTSLHLKPKKQGKGSTRFPHAGRGRK